MVGINPTTLDEGQGYSYSTSGSPSWNSLSYGFDKSGQKYDCWDEEYEKGFWKVEFGVVDFKPRRTQ